MRRFIFLMFTSGIAWSVFGQVDIGSINNAENFRLNVKNLKNISSLDDISRHFDGSVMLFDDWTEGVVNMSSGREETRMMNYFLLENSLVYKNDKDSILAFVFTDRIVDVTIGGRRFEMVTFLQKNAGTVETGVMEMLVEGRPLSIAKKYYAEIREGQDGSGYKEATRPSIIAKSQLYYERDGENIFASVPLKKKEFYSIFGGKANEIEEYCKRNKLRINEDGIVKMSEYYNSLF